MLIDMNIVIQQVFVCFAIVDGLEHQTLDVDEKNYREGVLEYDLLIIFMNDLLDEMLFVVNEQHQLIDEHLLEIDVIESTIELDDDDEDVEYAVLDVLEQVEMLEIDMIDEIDEIDEFHDVVLDHYDEFDDDDDDDFILEIDEIDELVDDDIIEILFVS